MTTITGHTTRATGTILTAAIYNFDHGVHITNAQALNAGKIEGANPPTVAGNIAVFANTLGTEIEDSGTALSDLGDGDVVGPASSTADHFAMWNGTTGKLLKDSTMFIEATVADFSHGILKYTSGESLAVISVPIAELTSPVNGDLITYNSTADEFQLQQPPASGAVQLLTSGVISSPVATLDIVLTTFTAYKTLMLKLESFVPATDDVELWMRFSTNGGSSYDATGYAYGSPAIFGNNTSATLSSASANQIALCGDGLNFSVSNVAGEGPVDVNIEIMGRLTARYTRVFYQGGWTAGSGSPATDMATFTGAAIRRTAQDTDAIRVLFETGNIASGSWALYGWS